LNKNLSFFVIYSYMTDIEIPLYYFMRSSKVPRSMRFGVRSRKLSSNVGQSLDGGPNIYYLEILRASESTLRRWSKLNWQSLAPTNPHWIRVLGYGPYFLKIILRKGLRPSSGSINRLMMMIINIMTYIYHSHLNPKGVAEASRIFLREKVSESLIGSALSLVYGMVFSFNFRTYTNYLAQIKYL
jgi:hypothetical protein